MPEFIMTSLVGEDKNGDDIIVPDETWVTLNTDEYLDFFEEVKNDNAKNLIELTQMAGQISFLPDSYSIHFPEYDLPVVVISSESSTDQFFKNYGDSTPGFMGDNVNKAAMAVCLRNRLKSNRTNRVCLFPFIVMPVNPPLNLIDSPLLAHEMVHLRYTLSERYDENYIRTTYFNAKLQDHWRKNFHPEMARSISGFLIEEWEACAQNFDPDMRQRTFTNVYIPKVLAKCAENLDWWLNDEGGYLNIGRTSCHIAETLHTILTQLGYSDDSSPLPMDPLSWKNVSEAAFREAYASWKKHPGHFVEKFSEAIRN